MSDGRQVTSIPKHLKYKNQLQEYAQKEGLSLPIYLTNSEGRPHFLKFKSTVTVAGKEYTTDETFMHRKEAEQQAAKRALDFIAEKRRNGDELRECFLIFEGTKLYKSILNEFAVKVHLERHVCETDPVIEDDNPGFKSSIIFNSVYSGDFARNKREAQLSAYRCAILSFMGNAESQSDICEVIKTKRKIYDSLHTSDSQDAQLSNLPVAVGDIPSTLVPLAVSTLPPESSQLPMDGAEGSSKKRRENEINTSKKLKADALNLDLNRDDSMSLNPVEMPTSVNNQAAGI